MYFQVRLKANVQKFSLFLFLFCFVGLYRKFFHMVGQNNFRHYQLHELIYTFYHDISQYTCSYTRNQLIPVQSQQKYVLSSKTMDLRAQQTDITYRKIILTVRNTVLPMNPLFCTIYCMHNEPFLIILALNLYCKLV